MRRWLCYRFSVLQGAIEIANFDTMRVLWVGQCPHRDFGRPETRSRRIVTGKALQNLVNVKDGRWP